MPHTGQRPGAGRYECESCGETLVLNNEYVSLPFCPGCKYTRFSFIEAVGSEDITDQPVKTGKEKYADGNLRQQKKSSVKPTDPEKKHLDDKLEEALEDTFPASDPIQLSAVKDKTVRTNEQTQGKR